MFLSCFVSSVLCIAIKKKSIVFVQECSVIFRNVFDEGRLERPGYEFVERITSKIDHGGHCGFMCLQSFFRKYDVF